MTELTNTHIYRHETVNKAEMHKALRQDLLNAMDARNNYASKGLRVEVERLEGKIDLLRELMQLTAY